MDHTALPWQITRCVHAFENDPDSDCCLEIVPASDPNKSIAAIMLDNMGTAGLSAGEGKANAAYIVRAVNHHQPLLDALVALNWCRMQEHRGTACCPAMKDAYAALQAVREVTP